MQSACQISAYAHYARTPVLQLKQRCQIKLRQSIRLSTSTDKWLPLRTMKGLQGGKTIQQRSEFFALLVSNVSTMVTMVTMGGDLQPGCLADRLLTGLGQPQINP